MSVTVLLFVTNTFVAESYVRGEYLLPSGGAFEVWTPAVRCRWTSVERNDWLSHWGARFDRKAAGDLGRFHNDQINFMTGHFVIGTEGFIHHLSNFFRGKRDRTTKGQCYLGLDSDGTTPEDFPMSDIVLPDGTARNIPNVVHPLEDPDMHCFYQCVSWTPFSLPNFIANIGS